MNAIVMLLSIVVFLCHNEARTSFLVGIGDEELLAVKAEVQSDAQELYQYLNESPYFNTHLLRNIPDLCRQCEEDFSGQCERGVVAIDNNTEISYTHFNRYSDTLIVIGPGFPTPRQQMMPFVAMLRDYDVVLFDYRGQGLEYALSWSWNPRRWLGSCTYKIFGIDMSITGLGSVEVADCIAVVNVMKRKKTYNKVYGLGLCYSSLIFAQAQASRRIFDGLILDGSWPVLVDVIKKIAKDPSLVFAKHPPSSPWPWLTHQEWFQNAMCALVKSVIQGDMATVDSLSSYLARCDIPILFFQCRNDCYCSFDTFRDLFKAVAHKNKFVVLTENVHGKNHLVSKELYAMMCNEFVTKNVEEFAMWMRGLSDVCRAPYSCH